MNILFLGAPGCGKGTQSKIIIEKYKIPQISTGDLLRNEIQSKTDLGLQIKDIISSGKFVSDEIVLKLVSKKLDQDDCGGGFILDGYPRNIAQAESLDKLFNNKDLTLEYVFLIDVPSEILIQRCIGRLICDSCGWITNSFFDDKNEKEKCSKCNQGILLKREDDNEETNAIASVSYECEENVFDSLQEGLYKFSSWIPSRILSMMSNSCVPPFCNVL